MGTLHDRCWFLLDYLGSEFARIPSSNPVADFFGGFDRSRYLSTILGIKSMIRFLSILAFMTFGFAVAKVDDHVRPTMWGWVWQMTPDPAFYKDAASSCRDGWLTPQPWHVLVLYDEQAPFKAFLQERGR